MNDGRTTDDLDRVLELVIYPLADGRDDGIHAWIDAYMNSAYLDDDEISPEPIWDLLVIMADVAAWFLTTRARRMISDVIGDHGQVAQTGLVLDASTPGADADAVRLAIMLVNFSAANDNDAVRSTLLGIFGHEQVMTPIDTAYALGQILRRVMPTGSQQARAMVAER